MKDIVLSEAVKFNIRILQVFGYCPINTRSKLLNTLHDIYSYLLIIIAFLVYMVAELINIILSINDLDRLIEGSFLFLTHLAQLIKLYFVLKHRRRFQQITDGFERSIFKPFNEYQRNIISNGIKESKIIFIFFMTMGWATCLLWGLFPVLEADSQKYKLPLPSYYPFRTDKSPNFELIYIYQIVATAINASTNISLDTLVSGYMSLIGGQLDILSDCLANLKQYAIEKYSTDENKETCEDSLDIVEEDVQKAMDQMLVHCVNHHRNILEVSEEITEIFNIAVLSQFVVSCIIICETMYKLTLVHLFSLQFISLCTYQGCMLFEIIVYCWFGNEIILKSSTLSFCAYKSEWINCSLQFKKKLLFLMIRLSVPLKLYAGNFVALSLETLTSILKTSWSYFAVLNQVQAEE